jgi:peptidyl-prolyl cis-trans isomerase B (cyclophilin B)
LAGSRERERRRARERYERQRELRVARQRKLRQRFGIGLAVACVVGLVAGLTIAFAGGSTPAAAKKPAATASPKASASASSTATAAVSAAASAAAVTEPATHCTYTSTESSGKPSLPSATPDYKAAYTATINTNLGKIAINLLNSKATCTVNSFVHLAETNFWNNTQCHRVSDSDGLYILQCGDPTAKASQKLSCSSTTLGSGTPGYEFADENLTGATYKAGTVAMANGGANTNGSQFFLVFKDTSLPASYTPFGTITSGLDILQNVAKAGTTCTFSSGGGVPKEKVVINSVTIKQT